MSLKVFGGGGGGAPSAHKTTHEPGGSDALTLLDNTSIKSGAAIALAKLAGYGGHYRSVYIAGARATSAGAASTKYFFYTNQIDISTAGAGVGNQIYMFPFYAADYAVHGPDHEAPASGCRPDRYRTSDHDHLWPQSGGGGIDHLARHGRLRLDGRVCLARRER